MTETQRLPSASLSRRGSSITLSARLSALADLAAEGRFCGRVADIGCDHGYLTAYLVLEGHATYAVAADINPGPLRAAAETFRSFGIADRVYSRLGDGLTVLRPGEVTCAILAGMGGMNIITILKNSLAVTESLKQLILSPERDYAALRRYLHVCGFYIEKEVLTEETGHFYFAVDARPGNEPAYEETGYLFGARLLEKKDRVLHRYLLKERERTESLKNSFNGKPIPEGVINYNSALLKAIDKFL